MRAIATSSARPMPRPRACSVDVEVFQEQLPLVGAAVEDRRQGREAQHRAVVFGEQGEGQVLAVARQQTRHFRRAARRIGRSVVRLHVGQQARQHGAIGRAGAADGGGAHAAFKTPSSASIGSACQLRDTTQSGRGLSPSCGLLATVLHDT